MSNEYMLIPYHLREPLLDVCMSSKLGTKEIEEIIANAPLYTAHDGEVVYQACSLGVGCEEAGVCYAMANGDSGKCGKNRGNL